VPSLELRPRHPPPRELLGCWGLLAGVDADPFFAEDLEAAQALVHSTDLAEVFLYPGEEHLFADSSLPAYDAAAAVLLTERVLAFLDRVQADASTSAEHAHGVK
jgi:dienelactone hydrolase